MQQGLGALHDGGGSGLENIARIGGPAVSWAHLPCGLQQQCGHRSVALLSDIVV